MGRLTPVGHVHTCTGVAGWKLCGRASSALFDRIAREVAEHPTRQFLVECSYFEVGHTKVYVRAFKQVVVDSVAPCVRLVPGVQ